MLNKTENNTNISSINPCSTESLIAVTGNDGETHIIQRELISHSVEGHEATIIHLVALLQIVGGDKLIIPFC
ncbi:hypothetical protein G3D93_004610 [Salmonella enterica subsp. enterica]|nr:hypothetical protein [Salmonella enterica subsp. enterica]